MDNLKLKIYNEVINSENPFEAAHDYLLFMIDLFHNCEPKITLDEYEKKVLEELK